MVTFLKVGYITLLLWCALASNQQPMLFTPIKCIVREQVDVVTYIECLRTLAVMKKLFNWLHGDGYKKFI
jgi:hypothetical protein